MQPVAPREVVFDHYYYERVPLVVPLEEIRASKILRKWMKNPEVNAIASKDFLELFKAAVSHKQNKESNKKFLKNSYFEWYNAWDISSIETDNTKFYHLNLKSLFTTMRCNFMWSLFPDYKPFMLIKRKPNTIMIIFERFNEIRGSSEDVTGNSRESSNFSIGLDQFPSLKAKIGEAVERDKIGL